MPEPRIPPLPVADLSDEQRELLTGLPLEGPTSAIFSTLVRHPGLFRKWMPFGGKLLRGKLPARDREILILRTAYNCRTDYEFGQHVLFATGAGLLSEDDVIAVTTGTPSSEADALLVRAADELHATSTLGNETWAALAACYDEQQVMEVPFVVGHYHMVGFVLNALAVQREAGVPGFPD
jgi:alkylhydroperoxidase family enzyme